MNDGRQIKNIHFAGYRIGETYCLSPSSSIVAIDQVPKQLSQLPGTKPWLLGAGRLGRNLMPFVDVSRFLSLVQVHKKTSVQAAICVKGSEDVGTVALVVDEMIEFIPASELSDSIDGPMKIPPGLGKCMRSSVTARDRTWALIDLQALITDEKMQNVDLTGPEKE